MSRHFTKPPTIFITTLFVLLLCLITLTQAKLTKGIAHMDSATTTEVFLGSFSFASHLPGTINGRLTVTQEGLGYYRDRGHSLIISVFDDAGWNKYNMQIKKGSICRTRVSSSLRNYYIEMPRSGNTIDFSHTITQSANVLNSYVILSDCALEDYPANPPAIIYEVTFKTGGEHLPQDERHMPILLSLALIPMIGSVGVFIYNMKKQHTKASQIHLIQLLIGVAFLLVCVSITAQLLHLMQYQNDGMGLKLRYTWFAMDFFSEITQVLSELIIAFVFISISLFGWLFSSTSSKMTSVLQRRYMPLFLGYIVLKLFLQYKSRLYEADFNYFFYDFQHWAGLAILLLRFFSLVLFIIGIAISTSLITLFIERFPAVAKVLVDAKLLTPSQAQAVQDGEKVGFLSQAQDTQVNTVFGHLTVIALIWFLAMPIAIACSLVFFQPSNRRLFVVSISLFVHLATLIWFLFAFTFDSLYYKASCLSNMGTVFGNTQSATSGGGFWSSKIAID